MSNPIFDLAIFLLRTREAAPMAEFYAGKIGVPIIRGREPTYYISLGGFRVLEILADKGSPARPADAFPVLGSRDLKITANRIGVVRSISRSGINGLPGLTDCDGNPVFFQDGRGEDDSYAPRCAPMAEDLTGLAGIFLPCADPASMAQFYARMLGVGADDSDTVTTPSGLELHFVAGGKKLEAPRCRSEPATTLIFRCHDHDKGLEHARVVCGDPVEGPLHFPSASLTYFADPEGRFFGIDERFSPERIAHIRRPFAEDEELRCRMARYLKENA